MPAFNVRPLYDFVFPLPEPLHPRFHNELLGQMSALMIWPNDEDARRAYAQSGFRDMHAILEEELPEYREHPLVQEMLSALKSDFGGWSSLRNLRPESEIEAEGVRLSKRASWAGATLFFLIQFQENHANDLEGGISLNKVRSFLSRRGEEWFGTPPEREAIKDAWVEFCTVPHFWAAKYFVDHWLGTSIRDQAEQRFKEITFSDERFRRIAIRSEEADLRTKHILVYAHRFQGFGLAFKPPRSRTTLLNPDILWRIEDLPDWDIPDMGIKFPLDVLETLNDY